MMMLQLLWLGCGLTIISGQPQDPELLARELEEAEITDYNLIDNVSFEQLSALSAVWCLQTESIVDYMIHMIDR